MSVAAGGRPDSSAFPLPSFRDAWRGIAIAVAGLAVVAAVSLPLAFALDAGDDDLAFALIYSLSAIAFELWIGVSALLAVRDIPLRERLARLGVRRPRQDDLWLAFVALAAAFVIFMVYSAIASGLDIDLLKPGEESSDDVTGEPAGAILLAIALVLVAPVVEELFYRGLLTGGFWSRWSRPLAVTIAAVLFCASHRDIGAAIPLLLVALILGYVYTRTGSIFITIIPHFSFNALTFIVVLTRS